MPKPPRQESNTQFFNVSKVQYEQGRKRSPRWVVVLCILSPPPAWPEVFSNEECTTWMQGYNSLNICQPGTLPIRKVVDGKHFSGDTTYFEVKLRIGLFDRANEATSGRRTVGVGYVAWSVGKSYILSHHSRCLELSIESVLSQQSGVCSLFQSVQNRP